MEESGLDGFKRLLREFRGLSVWAAGGATAVPFAAAAVALSPPWPAGIVVATAILELVALVFVYQFMKGAPRRSINRVLWVSAFCLLMTSAGYLTGLSLYSYQTPTTKERFVKGFECTPEAHLVFKDKCPELGADALRTAEYESERLWTERSVTIVRMSLVLGWSLAFIFLSVLLGSFLVYQMAEASPARSRKTSRRSVTEARP